MFFFFKRTAELMNQKLNRLSSASTPSRMMSVFQKHWRSEGNLAAPSKHDAFWKDDAALLSFRFDFALILVISREMYFRRHVEIEARQQNMIQKEQ